jgi:hypothetical protein
LLKIVPGVRTDAGDFFIAGTAISTVIDKVVNEGNLLKAVALKNGTWRGTFGLMCSKTKTSDTKNESC